MKDLMQQLAAITMAEHLPGSPIACYTE